jgi:hypothetical protein
LKTGIDLTLSGMSTSFVCTETYARPITRAVTAVAYIRAKSRKPKAFSVLRDEGVRIIVEAYSAAQMRCLCPECLRLDARYPLEGYQLALIPYRLTRPAKERLCR